MAVKYVTEQQDNADGTTTITETITIAKRATYPQQWTAYNNAQTTEKDHFQILLADLCSNLVTPPQEGRGQRRLPISDAIFAAAFKVYSTVSGRRFMCDLKDARDRGHSSTVPHYNSIFNYLEKPELTPILSELIMQSILPLKSVESDFAVDSSGFSTSKFVRWFDPPPNTSVSPKFRPTKPIWASITRGQSQRLADCRFIAFKSNSTGAGDKNVGLAYRDMYHYFMFRREDFLWHYHKRSNVETTCSMIKRKFGDSLRSKTDVAMTNESLCKILRFFADCAAKKWPCGQPVPRAVCEKTVLSHEF